MAKARYKITVEYIGTSYAGVVVQPGKQTISSALQAAIESVVGEGNATPIQWSSRTDSGVHATGNVCHVDITRVRKEGRVGDGPFKPFDVGRAVNTTLRNKEHSIQILDMELVPNEFHSRYHARKRSYLYRIIHPVVYDINRELRFKALKQVLVHEKDRSWQSSYPLNVEKMREATDALKGIHDFSSFRGGACVMKSPVRNIEVFDVERGNIITSGMVQWETLLIKVSCRSFLNRQVRNMVGAIQKVGSGEMSVQELIQLLESKDRAKAPPTAPPQGLYLQGVEYPSMEEIVKATELYEVNRRQKYDEIQSDDE